MSTEEEYRFKSQLMPHQVSNRDRMILRRRILLCDKAGKGKSACVLASYIHLLNANKTSVLFAFTPKTAYEKKVWGSETVKHTNLTAISLEDLSTQSNGNLVKAKDILLNNRVCYGKHGHVKLYADFLISLLNSFEKAPIICFDEIHAIKNPKIDLTKLWKKVFNGFPVWGLTATPLSRSLEDSYNIIDTLSPKLLGNFIEFKSKYCKTHEEVIGRNHFGGLRKIEKIDGFSNQVMFDKVTAHLIIKGETKIYPQFHAVDYKMSDLQRRIYRLIAMGISETPVEESADNPMGWLQQALLNPTDDVLEAIVGNIPTRMKDLNPHSTRFIYLQYAADGIVAPDGEIGNVVMGNKFDVYLSHVKRITDKGESLLMYFSFHAALDVMERLLKQRFPEVRLLKSTGKSTLKAGDVTAETVKNNPTVILCSNAGSESVSYSFINHVLFFHNPTVPSTFIQMVGRILRVDTLYPDDLHAYYPAHGNVDLYKLLLVSLKTKQMEGVAGVEGAIPDTYKDIDTSEYNIKRLKRELLWNNQDL